jgi:hypothetical protein
MHDDISPITGVHVYEWRAKCEDCKFSRWAGLGEATAGIFANGHWRRNPSHDVKTEYTINPEAVKTEAKFNEWHHPAKSRTRV